MARGALASLLLLALLAAPAASEIYRWVDAQGGEHFTTRLEEVPPPQREGAQSEAAGRRQLNRTAPAADAASRPAPRLRAERRLWEVPEQKPEGRDENWWRGEHLRRVERVAELEAEIAELDRLGVTQPPAPRRVSNASSRRWHRYMSRWRERQRSKRALETARRGLARFEERARRAGVPPGWLR